MRGVLQRRIGRLAGLSGGTRPHTPELAHVR
jgi:hypothetical protein